MKKYLSSIVILLIVGLSISCQEMELPTQATYSDYTFDGLDENGGNWNTILLADPTEISIAAPDDVSSAAYQAELADLSSSMADLDKGKREAVEYWTNNPALRWNEIALELIAKYNLIPGPNEDGSYTLPNPATPEGPSPFPFAHPPYAVRALAYLSVAQFDGLVAAWYYKYSYNRPAPSAVDDSIVPAYVQNALPSYPSDGAVIAASAKAILTAMFPLEADYISEKAAEHIASLQWAGINVTSDITAGQQIGEAVAQLALTRAKNDGMSKAQCSKAVSDSIKASAFERYGWQWDNLEIPVRPVGLTPLFSQVQMWNVPSLEEVRPPVPPAPGSAEYEENVKELIHYKDNMTEEWRAIANFWQDGLGTYTPPGHWNRFAKEFALKYHFNPLRTVRTLAYLNMAMMDGGISCWDAKYYYHYPRPIQNIPGYTTIAGTPNFPSYSSGHSVFSAAGAEILSYTFPQEGDLFREWALEAAISRVYGGIHWRFDAEVGTDQGIDVAAYTLSMARADGADGN